MKIGLIGLSLSGKTTLFNALTGAMVQTTSFMGGKSEIHQAVVAVPDERLNVLNEIFMPKKKVPATIEYLDFAGLSATEDKKQGFTDQFLGQLRTVDALCAIVRNFDHAGVPHPLNTLDPRRDLAIIEAEFILSDLAIIENRLERLEKQMRTQKLDQDVHEQAVLLNFKEWLESEKPLRWFELAPEDELLVRGYQFLTLKPLIIVLNINEKDIRDAENAKPLESWRTCKSTSIVAISARIEMELGQLSPQEAQDFQQDLGISQSAMSTLIRASYELLGLLSFFTVGEDEVRAWTIRHHTTAPLAAGAIHSDFERGFIRAEVVHYDDFVSRKTLAKCRSEGVLRLEGKEYIVKDGDIITFRFAV
jgi:GTP-binding protein YchF